ncbi:GxxExxY protein [Salinisphaera japonica]|uniref:GxxExxY protein n=1 Tax=Salinisphaera japonica YTM-1 TaxID=1209778 RepID=A0A423PUQ8_9GAMM|nr:GxxExxY protein [Salinisphaera japonica]ROO29309.1 GxxExxY protein [Salinisphaera japonica YTM-1]
MSANEKTISERVIGCAFAVSNTLGAGFLEAVYENALALELAQAGPAFERQKALDVSYKGAVVGHYIADLVIEQRLIVEIKALSSITAVHEAQLMNYLQATGISVGLILNFGTPRLGVKRIVKSYDDSSRI